MTDELDQWRAVAESEAGYGTDEVHLILQDGARDIIYQDLEELTVDPNRTVVEIARHRGVHSGVAHKTIGNQTPVTAKGAMTARVGSGAGEEAPSWAAWLKAANMAEDITASTSAVYKPVTKNQAGLTVYKWMLDTDGKHRLVRTDGVRGTISFDMQIDAEAKFEFSGIGLYEGEKSDPAQFFDAATGEVALLRDGASAVTARTTGEEKYANGTPVMCTAATITANDGGGAETWEVENIKLDLNWGQHVRRTINGSSNAARVINTRAKTGARSGGSLTLMGGGAAHDDMIAAWQNGSTLDLDIVLVEGDGSSGSGRITIEAQRVQIGKPSPSVDNGVIKYAVPFYFIGDPTSLADGTDFTLTFDAVP